MAVMVESICWYCLNSVPSADGVRGCSWSRSFKLVDGCEYEARSVGGCAGYLILSCPEFSLDAGCANEYFCGRSEEDGGVTLVEAIRRLGVAADRVKRLSAEGYIGRIGRRYSVSDIEWLLEEFERERELLTAREAGELLGIRADSVIRLAKEGRIPYRMGLRHSIYLMRREDVEGYAARRARCMRDEQQDEQQGISRFCD